MGLPEFHTDSIREIAINPAERHLVLSGGTFRSNRVLARRTPTSTSQRRTAAPRIGCPDAVLARPCRDVAQASTGVCL